jgi:hypothetical protein
MQKHPAILGMACQACKPAGKPPNPAGNGIVRLFRNGAAYVQGSAPATVLHLWRASGAAAEFDRSVAGTACGSAERI